MINIGVLNRCVHKVPSAPARRALSFLRDLAFDPRR
jgi:hypothetical protein